MGKKKHGTLNPTDKFRKDQRRKELKKNKEKRALVRDNGLIRKDVTQIQSQLQKINSVAEKTGKLDKAAKVKKRKLETQMAEVIKRKKDLEGTVPTREEYEKAMTVPVTAKTVEDLEEQNQYRYENPELSVYYHPTLNPYGAPPPGAAPMYRASSAANLLTGTQEGILSLPSSNGDESIAPLPPGPPPTDSSAVDKELENIPLPPGPEEEELPPLPDTPPPLETEETPSELPPIPPEFAAPLPPGMLPMQPISLIPPPPGVIPRLHYIPPLPTDLPFAYAPPPSQFIPPNPFPLVPPLAVPQYAPPTQHRLPPQVQKQQIPEPAPGPQMPEEEEPTVLVPTALRVRRDTSIKPQPKPTIASAYIKSKKETQQEKSKDQAFDKFMQDMKDLGAV